MRALCSLSSIELAKVRLGTNSCRRQNWAWLQNPGGGWKGSAEARVEAIITLLAQPLNHANCPEGSAFEIYVLSPPILHFLSQSRIKFITFARRVP